MGFASGDHGVKHFVCNTFPRATQRDYTMKAALTNMAAPYNATAIILDGNCKVMAVPSNVLTLKEYVSAMISVWRRSMRVARYVIMCFDDPTLVPPTKRTTQARRDARTASIGPGGLEGYPVDATFDVKTLEGLFDCRPLVENREMRYRFFDEILTRVLIQARLDADEMRAAGNDVAVLVVDGIDLRGASRRADMPRRPGVHGTDDQIVKVVSSLCRTEGEADVHTFAIERSLREGVDCDQMHLSVIVHETVDTDIFAIALRHHSNRVNREGVDESFVHSYIVIPERGKYAIEQLALRMNSEKGTAGVLVVGVETLYDEVMKYVVGLSWRQQIGRPAARVALVQRLIAIWALGGCDFVDRIANADLLTRVFSQCIQEMQTFEQWSDNFTPWLTAADARAALPEFRRLVHRATNSSEGLQRATRTRLEGAKDDAYLRAAWTAAYWGGAHQETFDVKVSNNPNARLYVDEQDFAAVVSTTTGRPYDYSQWGFDGVPDGTSVFRSTKRQRDSDDGDKLSEPEGDNDDNDESMETTGAEEELTYDSADENCLLNVMDA